MSQGARTVVDLTRLRRELEEVRDTLRQFDSPANNSDANLAGTVPLPARPLLSMWRYFFARVFTWQRTVTHGPVSSHERP